MSDESAITGDGLATLVDDAEDCLADVDDCLEGVESVDDLGDDDLDDLFGSVDRLVDLVDELEDALDAIDLTELPDVVDGTELLEAIELGEISDTLGDGDAGDVVELRPLIRAIDLTEAWNAADVHELWDAKGDLEETTEELTDDDGGEDEGVVSEAVDTATDVAGSVTDDDPLVGDEDDELLEGDVGDVVEDEFGAQFDLADGDSFGLDAEDTQAYQEMIQVQALEGVEELREAVLYAHETFRKLYEFNREKMRRQDTSTHSRNPTAVSTMPTERADLGSTARSTTVPRRVKGSTAPGFDRIYGRRFERELEKRRGETDG
ncbi:hypothetical protein [Natronobeatus ordinarius]|uniref:hypothetical protein n=1 Tax=Natronobeatus ordinarius TaxID=2963433 RepID=UPI0020CD048B|nr:hypothetical protein [Natronobeatus ordinarius]